jgi:hypothetical protein
VHDATARARRVGERGRARVGKGELHGATGFLERGRGGGETSRGEGGAPVAPLLGLMAAVVSNGINGEEWGGREKRKPTALNGARRAWRGRQGARSGR